MVACLWPDLAPFAPFQLRQFPWAICKQSTGKKAIHANAKKNWRFQYFENEQELFHDQNKYTIGITLKVVYDRDVDGDRLENIGSRYQQCLAFTWLLRLDSAIAWKRWAESEGTVVAFQGVIVKWCSCLASRMGTSSCIATLAESSKHPQGDVVWQFLLTAVKALWSGHKLLQMSSGVYCRADFFDSRPNGSLFEDVLASTSSVCQKNLGVICEVWTFELPKYPAKKKHTRSPSPTPCLVFLLSRSRKPMAPLSHKNHL